MPAVYLTHLMQPLAKQLVSTTSSAASETTPTALHQAQPLVCCIRGNLQVPRLQLQPILPVMPLHRSTRACAQPPILVLNNPMQYNTRRT
mmetsp:Transcript_15065/g.32662  ORF Transcript_15065/g.32662 Transcript_15065/m.32662 type:complete len:90 (+) Transcript_15065:90-359(+)